MKLHYPPLLALVCLFASRSAVADERSQLDFFEQKIRPVLVKHCYGCHSAEAATGNKLQANLFVDSRDGMLKGGDSGPAITPFDVEASLLMSALRFDGLKMPPKGKLSAAVVADFAKWIKLGAPDPRVVSARPSETVERVPVDDHWSFQPLSDSPPPTISNPAWPRSDIDRFVLSQLEQAKLKPVADAQSNVLARRLYFDLIGLPPSVSQLDRFLAADRQNRQDAVETLVEELLASTHFGERWARHWLDLVRYSETNGGDRNVIWPHAWRYRDYVIDYFNADRPYDEFIQEQIAGDLLPADSQELRDRQLVATGMQTLGPKYFMETQSERFKMDVVDEQMDVVGRAVLGLTISCARCHDHKFDSISTKDYYRLAGIFRSTYLLYGTAAPAGNQYGHDRPLQPIGVDGEKLHGPAEAWKQQVSDQTAKRNKARSDRYRVVRNKAAKENELKKLSAADQSDDAKLLNDEIKQLATEIADWDEKIKKLDAALNQIEQNPPPLPDYAMAVRDAEEPRDCHVCIRGQYNQLGDLVPRGFIAAIPHQPEQIHPGQSGRLQLARWLTAKENALTSRVAVNRVWQHLFGAGLVTSVNNFGVMGDAPSHLELLDYLAARFQEDGYSFKALIRRIAISRTYQLASDYDPHNHAVDPGNRHLWRMNRRRLEAEPLRDAILAVSGTLKLDPPPASVVASEFSGSRELNATVKLSADQLSSDHRSVYLPVARMSLPAALKIWDFPDPSLIAGQRADGPTVDQQLFFLNSPLVIRKSRDFAVRLLDERQSDESKIRFAWLLLFSRLPQDDEMRRATEFLSESRKQSNNDDEIAWSQLCQALFASGEFRFLD